MPHSQLKSALADVLVRSGFLVSVSTQNEGTAKELVMTLKYSEAPESRPALVKVTRISKPGQRVYVSKRHIPRVNQGLGVAILSTPQGLLTDGQARKRGIGGEVICTLW